MEWVIGDVTYILNGIVRHIDEEVVERQFPGILTSLDLYIYILLEALNL